MKRNGEGEGGGEGWETHRATKHKDDQTITFMHLAEISAQPRFPKMLDTPGYPKRLDARSQFQRLIYSGHYLHKFA